MCKSLLYFILKHTKTIFENIKKYHKLFKFKYRIIIMYTCTNSFNHIDYIQKYFIKKKTLLFVIKYCAYIFVLFLKSYCNYKNTSF